MLLNSNTEYSLPCQSLSYCNHEYLMFRRLKILNFTSVLEKLWFTVLLDLDLLMLGMSGLYRRFLFSSS